MTSTQPSGRFYNPPWMPRALRLRSPRVRISHHQAAHHTLSTIFGLMFLYVVWFGWAVLLVFILVMWWMLLVYYWIFIGLYLGARWAVRQAITVWADHRT